MGDIEKRVKSIEDRNKKVELDKRWETSLTRRASIMALTYLVVLVYLVAIGNDRPFLNALVPVAGFLLSTLALKAIRDIWQTSVKK